tara:strand:+ start:1315 stop:2007 length:693 start_codon:yes stop_codon:yes gene_type:complete
MKKIGVLGGMSVTSTKIYYNLLCQYTLEKLGGLNSPDLIIRSLNFAEIEKLQTKNRWEEAGIFLNREAKVLEKSGAEILLLATNTMHKITDLMLQGTSLEFIHIGTATANQIVSAGFKKPALIATKFTMEEEFYRKTLMDNDLHPMIPEEKDRHFIHKTIYTELCKNVINERSRDIFINICAKLKEDGADCVILGCTEVCLLLNEQNCSLPVFDTTQIHCKTAITEAFRE